MGNHGREVCEVIGDWVIASLRAYAVIVLALIWATLAHDARADPWPNATIQWYTVAGSNQLTIMSGPYATADLAKAASFATMDAPTQGSFCGWEHYGPLGPPGPNVEVYVPKSGGGCPENSFWPAVASRATCAGGQTVDYSTTPVSCKNTACAAKNGKIADSYFMEGVAAAAENAYWIGQGALGTRTCDAGCQAVITSASCTNSGDSTAQCSTVIKYNGEACGATDRLSVSVSNQRTPVSATDGGTSGGGVGSTGGADSTNIARTATNTDRIARQLASGLTIAGGGGGATCGGPAQPPCKVDYADDGTAAAAGASSVSNAAISSAAASGASRPDITTGPTLNSPDGSARWTFSLAPFLGTPSDTQCNLTWDVTFLGHVYQAGYQFCLFTTPLKEILYWVVAVFTAVAIWNTIYGNREA